MQNSRNRTILHSAVGCLSAVSFLKFLKENDFRIIGTDITDLSVGKFYVDKFYEVPKALEAKKVIDNYIDIVKRENVDWIISGPEQEILILMKEEKKFNSLGTKILHPPLKTLEIITDKLSAFQFFSKKGIEIPPVYNLSDSNFSNGKVIIKPKKGRGSSGIFIVEAGKIKLLRDILPSSDYIVQEFIEGEEFTVDVLYDLRGDVLNIIPRKRLKTDSGISIIAEAVRDENLFEIIMKISGYLKFVGGNCFQFIKDKKNRYYLTDINPRFGGGFILSLKASKSLKANLIHLLKEEYNLLSKPSFDFENITMYRLYEEVFKSI